MTNKITKINQKHQMKIIWRISFLMTTSTFFIMFCFSYFPHTNLLSNFLAAIGISLFTSGFVFLTTFVLLIFFLKKKLGLKTQYSSEIPNETLPTTWETTRYERREWHQDVTDPINPIFQLNNRSSHQD